jgi:methylglutaconyl-CoA hydratase
LDAAVAALAEKLSRFNPEAMARLKTVFWQGTEHWEKLLETRAELSGKLVLSEFTSRAIRAFKQ